MPKPRNKKQERARAHTHTQDSRTNNLQPERKPTFLLLTRQSNPSRLTHIQSNNSAPAKSLLSLRRRRRKEIRSYLNNRRWKWNSSDLPHGFFLLLTRTPTSSVCSSSSNVTTTEMAMEINKKKIAGYSFSRSCCCCCFLRREIRQRSLRKNKGSS